MQVIENKLRKCSLKKYLILELILLKNNKRVKIQIKIKESCVIITSSKICCVNLNFKISLELFFF